MKKCKKCGAPLEGFLYNTIGKLIGLKPSAKDPELCNKCEEETVEVKPAAPAPVATPEVKPEPAAPEAPKPEEPKEETNV